MSDDALTVDEAKEFVLANLKFPDYALTGLIEKANAGHVVWEAHTPAAVNYQTHKFSFIDAIMCGLSFCGTNCIDDWAVLGPQALAVVRTLPQFVEKPETHGGKMNFVGMIASVKIYAFPEAERDKFWVGHAEKCCVGTIMNG
jgi:hypothetical protein